MSRYQSRLTEADVSGTFLVSVLAPFPESAHTAPRVPLPPLCVLRRCVCPVVCVCHAE